MATEKRKPSGEEKINDLQKEKDQPSITTPDQIEALQKVLLQQGEALQLLYSNMQMGFSSGSRGVTERGINVSSEQEDSLKGELNTKLHYELPVTVAFPPCTDVLLSLFKFEYEDVELISEYPVGKFLVKKMKKVKGKEYDEVVRIFLDYFGFNLCEIPINNNTKLPMLPHAIINYNYLETIDEGFKLNPLNFLLEWPPVSCFPVSSVTLKGNRHFYRNSDKKIILTQLLEENVPEALLGVYRLFIGDVVWLYFMERMGLFKILGKVLDEYAYNGSFPISNGSADPGPKDDILALALEAMTRQMEMGTASKVRDRSALYRTCLGWVMDNGRNLGLETNINTAFNTQFHKFIYLALEYYKDKRIKDAIQASTSNSASSGATLVTIRSTMNLLKKSFDNFDYGRNYYNTLSGIVWAVSSFSVIREVRQTIGIPPQYDTPYEYIPAAYDLLVQKRTATPKDTNRFETHYECATNARDILIDIELLDSTAGSNDQKIETWLSIVETKIEGYRTAYRALTGVDLGTTQNPVIEQQV